MSVWAAYLVVLMVWSTTPLAISWSNESFQPMAALSFRLILSLAIILCVRPFLKSPAMDFQKFWKTYAGGAMGLFPCMALVYWSTDYLPSSLISVLFGLCPFAVVLLNVILARIMGGGAGIAPGQILGMVLAFVGLMAVMLPGDRLESVSIIGVSLNLAAVFFYALSTLIVKQYSRDVDLVNQLVGALLFAAPCFLFGWILEGATFSGDLSAKSIYATLYLGAVGSVLAFLAYFYLLRRISVAAVSLIPMVTPVIAVLLGFWLNAEVLGFFVYIGIGCILAGLWLFRFFENNAA